MPTILTQPVQTRPKASDELDHVVCRSYLDQSLCGLDVSDQAFVDGPMPDNERACHVCQELDSLDICPICGEDLL